jgi:hypothetical protein
MVRTYVARSDKDGQTVTILADQPSINTSTHDGRGSVPGLAEPDSVTTLDGRPLRVLAQGVYQLPDGEILRCDHPQAP